MDWETAKGVPWGILILFGGGFALAAGFTSSGLSDWIGGKFIGLAELPSWSVILSIAATITGLTELTSNTATTTMIMPILASLAQTIEVNPLLLMIPATLAASCAFVLPVSTPPNAIVYGSGRITIMQMIKAGIIMEVIAFFLIIVLTFTMGALSFDVLGEIPAWIDSGP